MSYVLKLNASNVASIPSCGSVLHTLKIYRELYKKNNMLSQYLLSFLMSRLGETLAILICWCTFGAMYGESKKMVCHLRLRPNFLHTLYNLSNFIEFNFFYR